MCPPPHRDTNTLGDADADPGDVAVHNASVASDEPWNPAIRWPARLGALLVVLFSLNLVAALVGPHLSEPLVFARPIAQIKAAHLRELTGEACIDIVALGDSFAGFAVDPDVLVARFPGSSAYNAGLTGSVASIDAEWAQDHVVPITDPSVVLVVASSLTFAPDTPLAALELADWERARETRDGLLGTADRAAADLFPLVRYRSRLADPDEWRRLLTGEERLDLFRDTFDQTPDDIRNARGQVESARTFDPSTPQGQLATRGTEEQLLRHWSVDPAQVEALRQLIQQLATDGHQPVLVTPPVTQQYIDGHPNGAEDYQRYVDTVEQLAAGATVPLVDLSGTWLPASAFVDTHHLNIDGAATFSNRLADELMAAGRTVVPCGDGVQ